MADLHVLAPQFLYWIAILLAELSLGCMLDFIEPGWKLGSVCLWTFRSLRDQVAWSAIVHTAGLWLLNRYGNRTLLFFIGVEAINHVTGGYFFRLNAGGLSFVFICGLYTVLCIAYSALRYHLQSTTTQPKYD